MRELIIKLSVYRKALEAVIKELESLPLGRLTKRGKYYGHAFNGTEVSITGDEELIDKLCWKSYLLKYKKQLEISIVRLSRCISKLDNALQIDMPSEIINSLSPAYQDLPKSYFFHPKAKEWLAEPYEVNPLPLGNLCLKSLKGTQVRSKSEFAIVNEIEGYDIPYRYESAITLDGQTFYPDFLIMNPYTGKLIIWEHFGGLDFPGYMKKLNAKMDLYIKHGFIPFETLIYTFEFNVMDISHLHYLIENVILKP